MLELRRYLDSVVEINISVESDDNLTLKARRVSGLLAIYIYSYKYDQLVIILRIFVVCALQLYSAVITLLDDYLQYTQSS